MRFDLLMVQKLRGAEAAGHYSIAVPMADMLYLLPATVGAILFPKLAVMPPENAGATTRRTAWGVACLMVPLASGAILLARPAIALVFGEPFAPAAPAFMVLVLGTVALGVTTIFSQHLAALGFPWFCVGAWLAAAAANVALNLWWIPRYGIAGAAWASLVCYLGAGLALGLYAYLRRREASLTGASGL